MVTPVFHGRVDVDGILALAATEADSRRLYLKTLAGSDVDIAITEHRDTRSIRANSYYWAAVLGVMSEAGSGGDQSPEEIHDAMCEMFLPNEKKRIEFFNQLTGERLGVDLDPRRTSKLKGDAFYTFVEQVRKFALEFMGVRTEDPDPEFWRKRASVEP